MWPISVNKKSVDRFNSQYDNNDEVLKAPQHCLRSLPEDYLIHEFHKFLGHCKAVIRSGGDYVTCWYCRFYVCLCNSVFYCLLSFILIQTKYILYIYIPLVVLPWKSTGMQRKVFVEFHWSGRAFWKSEAYPC